MDAYGREETGKLPESVQEVKEYSRNESNRRESKEET